MSRRKLLFGLAGGAVVSGVVEEAAFRGYMQATLAQEIGFWPAALALSICFGLINLRNPGEAKTGLLLAACFGLLAAFSLRRTGTIWFAIGMHAAWDWGETFFYSVPDSGMVSPGHLLSSSLHGPAWLSGGSVGPEGSALCFLTLAAVWIAFDRAYPKKTRFASEATWAIPNREPESERIR